MNLPKDIKYTKEHEWVRVQEDGSLLVGVTDYAQDELGDVVFLEVESVGDHLKAGAVFATIEAVKTVSDLYMPVTGKVEEFNGELEDDPELVNHDPYGKGWIVKILPDNKEEVNQLLTADDYKTSIES